MVEIHFGEGGADAKNFVHELAGYYLKYANRRGLESDILDELDGVVTLWFKGRGVWDAFRIEGGKHVVQRIPVNERGGRAHTSIVTVAVLPLLPDLPKVNSKEFEWSAQRGRGKGGQNVNKVNSAVRMVHRPTGLSVFINGRDQKQNHRRAVEILTSKIAALRKDQLYADYNTQRTLQYNGRGRSDKDRTYSFIRGEVVDHRTGRSLPIWQVEKGILDGLR